MALLELTHEPSTSPPPDALRQQSRSDRIYFPIAPYDEDTGLPHLIAPPEGPVLNPASPHTSWHHRQGTERLLLGMNELGRGIRTSCLQLARNVDHNFGEHTFHSMTGNPHLPASKTGKIALIILNVANAVTDQVFDPKKDGPRKITDEERQRLFTSGEIIVQSTFSVRRSLTRFTIKKGMKHMELDEVKAFKDATSEEARVRIVNRAMGKFLPIVFPAIDAAYQLARQKGFLPDSAPECAAEVARQYIFEEPDKVELFRKYFNKHLELDVESLAA